MSLRQLVRPAWAHGMGRSRWASAAMVILCCRLVAPAQAEEPASPTVGAPESPAVEQTKPADSSAEAGPAQGPAMTTPREVLEMLEQRKRALDRREAAVQESEMHLTELKAELEAIVSRHEKLVEADKKRQAAAQAKAGDQPSKPKAAAGGGAALNVNQTQLAKIYESMPPEEAAARLERMPERKAIEVLRLLKGKSAGSILAEVKPERAARLTEQLLTRP